MAILSRICIVPRILLIGAMLSAILLFHSHSANSQETASNEPATAVSAFQKEQQVESIIEGFNREDTLKPETARSPLSAALGLRKSLSAGDFATAGKYLDMRYLPEDVADIPAERLVRGLAFVWSMQNILDLTTISGLPDGHLDDGLPSYRDQVGSVQLSNSKVPIFLQRIPDGEGGQVWRVSNATVALIPRMWEQHGFSDAIVWLANTVPPFTFLGMQSWQIVTLVAGLIALWFVAGFVCHVAMLLSLRIPNQFPEDIRRFWSVPMRVLVHVLLFRSLVDNLGLSIVARVYLKSSPLEFLAITIFLLGTLTLWRDYKIRKLERENDIQFVALLRPMVLIVKLAIVVVASLTWAHQAGFDTSTLIAGLGVGSLAIALAAQKTLENVIGAGTLYTAKPVRPGDLCRFGDITGHVIEIGLRSVSIRTLERTVVTIPNSTFSSVDIENISARDRIQFLKRLQLQMSSANQLRVILGELRALFLAHPEVIQETVSIRLEKIEAATAVIRVDAGINTRDYQVYLAVAEDLNLRIIELVHANGAIFSGPGQVLQVRDFYQADNATIANVDEKLEQWREQGEYPFPDWPDDAKTSLKGSLEYPSKA